MFHQLSWCALAVLLLAACANSTPARPPLGGADVSTLASLAKPACGARIYAIMGINQKHPDCEGCRIPRGDLFVNGQYVDTLTKNPELSVIDVPAGKIELSWMVSNVNNFDRSSTRQNARLLSLDEGDVAYIVLDYHDDTVSTFGLVSILATLSFRTEIRETRDASLFLGKRVVFHKPLDKPCSSRPASTNSAVPPSGLAPTTSDRTPIGEYFVRAAAGAPAFAQMQATGLPVHTFANGARLNVVEVTADERWIKVLLPDGSIAFIPASVIEVR